MSKDIKDYLHLYLGVYCQRMGQEDVSNVYKLTGVSFDDTQRQWWAYFENEEDCYAAIEDVFPILRPLSDMTEEELLIGGPIPQTNTFDVVGKWSPDQFVYLLSKGFDLFGLIEAGLAIDKTKLLVKV
jgi:hypothetical protein